MCLLSRHATIEKKSTANTTHTHTQVVLKPLAVPDMQFSRVDGTSDALYAFELAVRAHTVCISVGPVHTLERYGCEGLWWVQRWF